jgi:glycine/D-amino acid oxidase-like deaminating enzyme
VDAPRIVRAFVNRALAEGADLWRGARVRALRSDDGRVTGVDTDRGEVRAGQVLLCAGTGTSALLAPLGVRIPVRPVPGLLAVTSPIVEPLRRVVYAPGVHLRPDVDGGLRIGADDIDDLTSEITPAGPPPDFARPLLERAKAVYPPARDAATIRVHIGVRPVPEDGLTVAGPVPGVANAWVIVTHSGITMGPLLGRLVAEEMTGGPMDPRLASFRPARFAGVRTDRP